MSAEDDLYNIVKELVELNPHSPRIFGGEWDGNECFFCSVSEGFDHYENCLWTAAKNCMKTYFDRDNQEGE
jgi:hypothetical protein